MQTGNQGNLLSVDFGMPEWDEHKPQEIVHKYREFVNETGAVDAGKGAVIEQKIVDKERKRKYKISRWTASTTAAAILQTPESSALRSSWVRPQ